MTETESNTDYKYAVLRLNAKIKVSDVDGSYHEVNLTGCAGYIPVFDTIEEAKKSSCDGKYRIIVIQADN